MDLDFGEDVTYATPGEDSVNYGDENYTYSTSLETDLDFTVRIE
ncbi:MAG: hypothetical protein UY72_C0067G0002 [Candidatus Uhrbacteria bacterium GW2011_GWD2_52_7]|uniref:Uncharacterized protein n=1 Tax=Candidatus Uhrbacteria bacterium GW2011_GWD2_52_7 TaxID=1618989 RepID=A0A0G1XB91_9BACT|nr:MAG: hypothetical protein UY72_C0067G0002 [Candidatus Uhrbacteria bacterium GW2011_GWD2_52_7]